MRVCSLGRPSAQLLALAAPLSLDRTLVHTRYDPNGVWLSILNRGKFLVPNYRPRYAVAIRRPVIPLQKRGEGRQVHGNRQDRRSVGRRVSLGGSMITRGVKGSLVFALALGTMAIVLDGCSSPEHELDQVCEAFQQLQRHPALDSMSANARMSYVEDRVGPLSALGHVRMMWESVPNTTAESRYNIFKTSADELLGRDWRCSAMEQMAPTLGN